MAGMAWDRVAVASLCLLMAGAACRRPAPAERGGEARGTADKDDYRTPVPTKRPRRPKTGCLADTMGKLVVNVMKSPDCGEDAADFKCARACGRGDAAACYQHGLAIENESETDGEAHRMYQKACELGVAIACTNFAADLWVTNDYASVACAQRILQKTCAADDPWGCGMLGRLLIEDADATRADRARARAMLEEACDRLGSFSCRALAIELEGGNLGSYKRSQARKLRARACATGDTDGCGTSPGASATSPPASAAE
jgi:hypothetical protein